jgi:hypothetical protein
MFSQYFYNRLFYKYIVLFGNVFSNITVKRMSADFSSEIERIKVPILWGQKEKYVQRVSGKSDPPAVQTMLPRMGFEMVGLRYAKERKLQNLQRHATLNLANNSVVWAAYSAAPYDLEFVLTIKARNFHDAWQVVEQIMPYFQPDYTPTANLVENLKIPKDVKIVLREITPDIDNQGSLEASTRDVEFRLAFTMEGYFWGPITSEKVITRAITNVYTDSLDNPLTINLGDGEGLYRVGEIVYQGNNSNFAVASGEVIDYYGENTQRQLIINVRQGKFQANLAVKSTEANGNYVLTSFAANVNPVATFTVTPNPTTANADSVFGFTIEVNDYDE